MGRHRCRRRKECLGDLGLGASCKRPSADSSPHVKAPAAVGLMEAGARNGAPASDLTPRYACELGKIMLEVRGVVRPRPRHGLEQRKTRFLFMQVWSTRNAYPNAPRNARADAGRTLFRCGPVPRARTASGAGDLLVCTLARARAHVRCGRCQLVSGPTPFVERASDRDRCTSVEPATRLFTGRRRCDQARPGRSGRGGVPPARA